MSKKRIALAVAVLAFTAIVVANQTLPARNPFPPMRFAPADAKRPDALQLLLRQNGLPDGLAQMSTLLKKRFREIETDFVLSASARRTLDLAAYVLVHFKLAADLDQWNTVLVEAARSAPPEIKCIN